MTRENILRLVEQEFAVATPATVEGSPGMARVCARRAAGAAIAYWLQTNDRPGWRTDAMSRIRHLEADNSFPQEVERSRQAADGKSHGTVHATFLYRSDPGQQRHHHTPPRLIPGCRRKATPASVNDRGRLLYSGTFASSIAHARAQRPRSKQKLRVLRDEPLLSHRILQRNRAHPVTLQACHGAELAVRCGL